jgi:uncharacterized protein
LLKNMITRAVAFCVARAGLVVAVSLVLAIASGLYAHRHFAVDTNINNLIASDLQWRVNDLAYKEAFPQRQRQIVVVLDAPTAELAAGASGALARELRRDPQLFPAVQEAGGGEFFQKNGLLFLPTAQLKQTTSRLMDAEPLISGLATDPSLRGVVRTLENTLEGVRGNMLALDDMTRVLNSASDTLEAGAAGKRADFSWRALLQREGQPDQTRRIVLVTPLLDLTALEPGRRGTDAVRKAFADLDLAGTYGTRMRLTGAIPITDEEFASVHDGAAMNGIVTGVLVIAVLWLALRSVRLVVAVAATLAVGLVVTTTLGILMVGAFNPISIAFAVLFIGIGADFSLQYTVQYRAQRHALGERRPALVAAAGWIGTPVTLAALAAAIGFLAFVPTAYAGIAQLGIIAGTGMIVAFVTTLTLLPALIEILGAPPEPAVLSQPALVPVDNFLRRHRLWVVGITSALVLAGAPSLMKLGFDFNPLHLRDASTEAVATYLELSKNPDMSSQNAQVVVPTHDEALDVARRLAALPEVRQARTVDVLIPEDQQAKLSSIAALERVLRAGFSAPQKPQPSDGEIVASLAGGARNLEEVARDRTGPGAEAARRLAGNMTRLAALDAEARLRVQASFVMPLEQTLGDLRLLLQAQPISRESLPQDLLREWVTEDGRERVEAMPKGDSNDTAVLTAFAGAVEKAEPRATGSSIETMNWGRTIISAFVQASLLAFVAIALLLWAVLRNPWHVMATLVPLIVAAVMTFEICAMTGFALNYANIIALPMLLGVGVAFKIYYIIAWQRGETAFLQSSLTRAVFFSAVLTAVAFGSLWFSSHPGTSSMGKLLALSFVCTLAAAALFQPALMGEHKETRNTGH